MNKNVILLVLLFLTTYVYSYNHANISPELKKGDHFLIEFADNFEDYSIVKSDFAPLKHHSFRRLTLKCEVIEKFSNSISLRFSFDRLFQIDGHDNCFIDSYFMDESKREKFYENLEVDVIAKINLKNNSFKLNIVKLPGVLKYNLNRVIVNPEKSITTSSIKLYQYISGKKIKSLIQKYIIEWSEIGFNKIIASNNTFEESVGGVDSLPINYRDRVIKTFYEEYKLYRVKGANIKFKPNTTIKINTNGITDGEKIKMHVRGKGLSYRAMTKSPSIAEAIVKNGSAELKCYVEKYQDVIFSYENYDKEIKIIPNEDLKVSINASGSKVDFNFKSSFDGNRYHMYNKDLVHTIFKFKNIKSKDSAIKNIEKIFSREMTILNNNKTKMSAIVYSGYYKSLHYWAITDLYFYMMSRGNNSNVSDDLKQYYNNIDVDLDYFMHIPEYSQYLNQFRFKSEIYKHQGLETNISSEDRYYINKRKYKGYPKYFHLASNLEELIGKVGCERSKVIYHDFLSLCKSPELISEVNNVWRRAGQHDSGKSILDLELYILDKNMIDFSEDRIRIFYFYKSAGYNGNLESFIKELKSVSEEKLFKSQFELSVFYSGNKDIIDITDSTDMKFKLQFIKMNERELYEDASTFGGIPYYFQLISPDLKIISTHVKPSSFKKVVEKYLNSKESSKADNSRLWCILISSIILLFLISYTFIKIRSKQIKKREFTRRRLVELENRAFRSQINPHFMFNSLNSIQNLINKNSVELANNYLSQFGSMMRQVLNNSEKCLVPLTDEIELIENYLQLEKLRLPFAYNIYIKSQKDLASEEIPGMIIQPFVENAVVHGISPRREGNIEITIIKENDYIKCIIKDDGIGINQRSQHRKGNGKAMKMIDERLNIINRQMDLPIKIDISDRSESEKSTGTVVIIEIPV